MSTILYFVNVRSQSPSSGFEVLDDLCGLDGKTYYTRLAGGDERELRRWRQEPGGGPWSGQNVPLFAEWRPRRLRAVPAAQVAGEEGLREAAEAFYNTQPGGAKGGDHVGTGQGG